MLIVKNKIFVYISTRYLTYGLQFLLSLLIAAKLGPYFLGIYGMTQLVLNYFNQINFGIPHSLNVFLVHNKTSVTTQNSYILNAVFVYTILNIAIIIIFIAFFLLGVIPHGDYSIDKYLPYIVVIAAISYYNTIFAIVIRFRNQVKLLSVVGSIPVILNTGIIWFFSGEDLVKALVITQLFACVFVLLLAYIYRIVPSFSFRLISNSIQKQLIKKGFYLFLYNSCFYFILILTRTVISSCYSVVEFGYFVFSFTVANAVMLLIDSLNTIIFPKTIDVLSTTSKDAILVSLNKLRVGYIMSAHLLVYVAMLFYPLLICLFPKYQPTLLTMNIISLAVLMNTNSFGYMTLLIAQNKEKKAAFISALSLSIAFIICELLARIINVEFAYMPFSLLVAYMFFSFLATYVGKKLLDNKTSLLGAFKHFFSYRWVLPYFTSIILCVLGFNYMLFIPLVLFVCLNKRDLIYIKNLVARMMKNPNIIDV